MFKFLSYKGRSVWKGFFKNLRTNIGTVSNRTTVVTRQLIGKVVSVHNGKQWSSIPVRKKHLGFKMGQFIYTKKLGRFIHEQDKGGKSTKSNKGKRGK